MIALFLVAAIILFFAGIFWTIGILFFIIKWAVIIAIAYFICNFLYEIFF